MGERILSYCPQGLEHEKERFQNIYQSGYSVLTQAEDPAASFTEWDMGFDFYAPQTFLSEDGRRILIGWAGLPDTENTHRNLSVANGWQHCLTLPRELTVKDGKVFQAPVRELKSLDWQSPDPNEMKGDGICGWSGRTVLLEVSGIAGGAQEIRFGKEGNALNIRAQDDLAEISFLDRDGRPSECGGGRGRRIGRLSGPIRELTVLADSSVIEVFINGGEMTFTTRIYLNKDERELSVSGPGTYSLSVI